MLVFRILVSDDAVEMKNMETACFLAYSIANFEWRKGVKRLARAWMKKESEKGWFIICGC